MVMTGSNSMSPQSLPSRIRELLFIYQDGLMLSLIADALSQGGVLRLSGDGVSDGSERLPGERKPVSVAEAAEKHGGKAAYLEVAFRCLAQQGWLDRAWNEAGQRWLYTVRQPFLELTDRDLDAYRRVGQCVADAMPFERSLLCSKPAARDLSAFTTLVSEAAAGWPECSSPIVRQHLTGALLVPVLLGLHLAGMCDAAATDLTELPQAVLDLFGSAGLTDSRRGGWTEDGKVARSHAIYLGMVGSYVATLTRLHSLIFGDIAPPTHSQPGQVELHVDRELNVLASAAAHSRYFAAADEIIIDIFDRMPLESQPTFVMDMGCGDGSWLVHIHDVIRRRTIRGQNLARHPIVMVGVDYNAVCEEICLEAFRQHGIQGRFMLGDVTNPEAVAAAIAAEGLDMRDCLHVRSFIDHNRIYREPQKPPRKGAQLPTGAYVSDDDQPIAPGDMRQNLVEFLESWAPYAEPHGLLIIEAHCVAPDVTARHLGATHSLVFDTYHGFSRQYPVDFEVFMECAEEAGLRSLPYQQHRYPSRKPFVAISINRFVQRPSPGDACFPQAQEARKQRPGQWTPPAGAPGPDGRALHRFLYEGGELQRQRDWCRDATGQIVGDVLRHLKEKVYSHEAGASADRAVHIVDYGAGSGMATIELLRGLVQSGLMQQLHDSGIRLRLSLLDLPNDWFAMGYSLLADCPFVEFHSLRGDRGGFRQLSELFGAGSVDIVMASMVFHLVPPAALTRMFQNFADVMTPGGLLSWSSPDIGPATTDAVLFHDVDRVTRRRLLEYLERPDALTATPWSGGTKASMGEIASALKSKLAQFTAEQRAACAAGAERQVLSAPNTPRDLVTAAEPWFAPSDVRNAHYEITPEELLEIAFIPSNRRYFGEVADLPIFERLVGGILLEEVVPQLRSGRARARQGLSVQWTFGRWLRKRG